MGPTSRVPASGFSSPTIIRQQGGLARPVGADDAHDAPRGQEEGEAVDQQPVAVGLHHPFGVDHPVAEPGAGRDGELEPVGPPLGRLGLGHQVVEGGDPGLPLGLAGPRRHADPLELAGQRLLAGPVGLLLPGQPGLLLLQPRRVVALPGDPRPPVELEDPAGHVVEEVPVVGDGHDRARRTPAGCARARPRTRRRGGWSARRAAAGRAWPAAAGRGPPAVARRLTGWPPSASPGGSRRASMAISKVRSRSHAPAASMRSWRSACSASSRSKSASGSPMAAQTSLNRSSSALASPTPSATFPATSLAGSSSGSWER